MSGLSPGSCLIQLTLPKTSWIATWSSIDELEQLTGEKIPVADYAKHDKPSGLMAYSAGM